MKEVIGVRFRTNGRIYYFDPKDKEVPLGTKVVVETTKGIELGWVVLGRHEVDESRVQNLRPIQRLATEQDLARYEANKEKADKAFEVCVQKIRERDLKMKLISTECSFDNNKIMFYFTADGRVDFRELVKDLASVFRTRIELRQVGVRDEAKIRGGIGMCGRELCCHSYLADFIPVSIKMAKEQSLSLNPTKISGVCGRLMCCLKHEQDTYEYLNSKLPNVGDRVTAYDGVTGEVASLNVLRQKVKIYVTDEEGNKELVEYRVEELVSGPRGRKFDTDLSLLDPELSQLEDGDEEGEAGEMTASEGGQRRREAQKGGRNSRGRGGRDAGGDNQGRNQENKFDRNQDKKSSRSDRSDRNEESRDRKDRPQKDRQDRRQDREGAGKDRPEGEKKNRNRQEGGNAEGEKRERRNNWDQSRGKRQGQQTKADGAQSGNQSGNQNGNQSGNQGKRFHRHGRRPKQDPKGHEGN